MKRCQKCQKEVTNDSKFCEFCGAQIDRLGDERIKRTREARSEKWWYRLSIVIYGLLLIGSILIALLSDSWDVLSGIPAFLFYYILVRIIKIVFLYIVFGERPMVIEEITKIF